MSTDNYTATTPTLDEVVFERRNKEYGAYKLRQESTKTSLTALFMGVTLLVGAISIPTLVSIFNPQNDLRGRNEFAALVSRARNELAKIYQSSENLDQKRAGKTAAIQRLRTWAAPAGSESALHPDARTSLAVLG